MDHRLLLFFVISNLVYWSNAALTCYECATSINTAYNATGNLCSTFEKSKEFEVPCPLSTYCLKKTSELILPDGGIIRVEERRCAPQSFDVYRLGTDNEWHKEKIIEEDAYKDGCYPEQSLEYKASKIEYCYCSWNYCNNGKRSTETSLFHHQDAMSVIFIFNVVKLMRSVR